MRRQAALGDSLGNAGNTCPCIRRHGPGRLIESCHLDMGTGDGLRLSPGLALRRMVTPLPSNQPTNFLPVTNLIQKILDSPVIVGLLAICFTISMLLYWARVKRERSAEYRKRKQPSEGDRS